MTRLVVALLCLVLPAAPFAAEAQPDSGAPDYFPAATFGRFWAESYARCLKMMAESKLFGTRDGTETYRVPMAPKLPRAYPLALNTGFDSTAVGAAALQSNTSGSGNTAVGSTALLRNTMGTNNTPAKPTCPM